MSKDNMTWAPPMLIAALLSFALPYAYASNTININQQFGRGNPFTLENLPQDKTLTTQIKSLSQQAKANALKQLHNVRFDHKDMDNLGVDKNGAVFYVEPEHHLPFSTLAQKVAIPAGTPAVDSSTVFKLHSRPQSANRIYLDFTGHMLTKTSWNEQQASYDAKAYDIDGNPTTFTDQEMANIAQVWQRVTNDFAPFDVDVTTEEPSTFTSTTAHVLITEDIDNNGQALPGYGSGGIAYFNVWGNSYYNYYSPVLVFANRLYYRPDYIGEAASHETGHNFGLSHDGSSSTSYYAGHGSGATSWGPIMGMSYGKQVSQWSNGDYSDANNDEDDIAIIKAKLSTIPDDHGNDFASATLLLQNGSAEITDHDGVISERDDVDMFSFTTGTGRVSFVIKPPFEANYTRGTNLDIKASLFNEQGQLISEHSSSFDTLASINTELMQGKYYLKINNTNNILTPYSSYGSLGRYTISGQLVNMPLPDTSPPTPAVMSWALAPSLDEQGNIQMTAVTAVDDSDIVYQLECISGGKYCTTSPWQNQPHFSINQPDSNTDYWLRVRAKDVNNNTNQWSAIKNNQAPIAKYDTLVTAISQTTLIDVLKNDSDPDGDELTISHVKAGTKGSVFISGKQILYTSGRERGDDILTYTIADKYGVTSTSNVLVSINQWVPTVLAAPANETSTSTTNAVTTNPVTTNTATTNTISTNTTTLNAASINTTNFASKPVEDEPKTVNAQTPSSSGGGSIDWAFLLLGLFAFRAKKIPLVITVSTSSK